MRGKIAMVARPVPHRDGKTAHLDCGVATTEDACHVISDRFHIDGDISFAIGTALVVIK